MQLIETRLLGGRPGLECSKNDGECLTIDSNEVYRRYQLMYALITMTSQPQEEWQWTLRQFDAVRDSIDWWFASNQQHDQAKEAWEFIEDKWARATAIVVSKKMLDCYEEEILFFFFFYFFSNAFSSFLFPFLKIFSLFFSKYKTRNRN